MTATAHVLLAWVAHGLDWIVAATRRGTRIAHPDERVRELLLRSAMAGLVMWAVATGTGERSPTVMGIGLLWGGTALAVLGRRQLGRGWGIGVRPHGARIAAGPFRWVRHPIYLGTLLAALGQVLLLRNLPSWLLLGCGIVVTVVKARRESRWFAGGPGSESSGV